MKNTEFDLLTENPESYFPKSNTFTKEEVLKLLEDYDRCLKINTFAYTRPCTFTVETWFERTLENKEPLINKMKWWNKAC